VACKLRIFKGEASTRYPLALPNAASLTKRKKSAHKCHGLFFSNFAPGDLPCRLPGGERSAIIYSIIESCRRHGIEVYTYLHDVLTRLPSMTNRQIKDIVPKAWAAARRNTALRAA
jgi:hypothetical protein